MSLLPPISAPIPHTAQPRDPVVFAASGALRPAPAVTATLTQSAVQHIKAGERASFMTNRDTVPVTDTRNRLVGPPPTFDVNLLQHIRETRNDLPDPEGADTQPAGLPENAPEARAEAQAREDRDQAADAAYRQLDTPAAPQNPADSMDTRV